MRSLLLLSPTQLGGGAVLLTLLALYPAMATVSPIPGVSLSFIANLLLFIMLAESYDLLGGRAGYVNLGHMAFAGIAAYAYGILFNAGYALPIAFILGVLPSLGFAALISIPFFRLRGFYFAVATLGLVELMRITSNNLAITGGFAGTIIKQPTNPLLYYYLGIGLAAAAVYVNYRISRSRFGLGLHSIREDEDAAEVFGIHTQRYKLYALLLSSFFAALAGELYMLIFLIAKPNIIFGLDFALTPVIMAMLGGTGTTLGPIVGAVVLFLLNQTVFINFPQLLQAVLQLLGSETLVTLTIFRGLILGTILILIGLFASRGLVGSRRLRGVGRRLTGWFRRRR